MSSIDWWDIQANRHVSGYLFGHGREISDRHPGRLREAVDIVRKHATGWAKECREAKSRPVDDGKHLWHLRMRQAEIEIAEALSAKFTQLTEQPRKRGRRKNGHAEATH